MKSEAKLLLGLGIGVALGAAVGYIMGTDKKEEWLEQANEFANLKINLSRFNREKLQTRQMGRKVREVISVEHDEKMVILVAHCFTAVEEKGEGVTFGRPILQARLC